MGKKCVGIFLVLALALLAFGTDSLAGDRVPVAMEVSAIYGETGKFGSHIPLRVSLYGQSETPFTGTVSVKTLESTGDSGEEVFQYSYPFSVKPAETKVLELYVPLGQKSSGVWALLEDKEGKVLDSQSLSFDISRDAGRLLVGSLSDEPEELSYFDGAHLEYGMADTRLVRLDETTLPKDPRGLELLDILVISSFDTGVLSREQTEAVSTWISQGGTLLLGTGARVREALQGFLETFSGLEIQKIETENVGLGTEYAENSPGDARLDLVCTELFVPGGETVMESDGVPLLVTVEKGKGRAGFFSFELGEIREFAEKNPGYTGKLLTESLGEEMISQLYYYSSYKRDDDYWSAQNLVSTGSGDRLPNIPVYAAVAAVYILAVGPGLYLFLKKKDLSRYYGVSVVAASAAASAVIYLMGTGTRFTSEFYDLATVLDTTGDSVEETTFLDVRTPDSRPFSMGFPKEYEITPLTRSTQYEEQGSQDFSRQPFAKSRAADVKLFCGPEENRLSVSRSRAFDSRYFKMNTRREKDFPGRIEGELKLFEGKLSGYIKNGYEFPFTDAALFFYGQTYPLGTLEPGEIREFHREPVLNWPVNMSYLAARQAVGADMDAEEQEYAEFLQKTDKQNLYGWYLDHYFGSCVSGARFSGLGPERGLWEYVSLDGQEADGQVLYTEEVPLSWGNGESIWRSGLCFPWKVVSGGSSDGLLLYGAEPVTVEYYLGTDIDVEKLTFSFVSPEFLDDKELSYLRQFAGSAYFYNNETKNYDPADLAGGTFTESVLAPYLSAENSLVVKYMAGENDSSGITAILPVPMVTGRER